MTNYDRQESDFFRQTANSDFEIAVRRGFWRSVMRWFKQAQNKLLPFDEVRQMLPTHGQYYTGLHEIPIDKIVGSVARYNDFDSAFIPRQRHTKSRWVSIDMANLASVILPPIEVYKIGDMYFVKDGNHRVSVAKEKGQAYIDAHVTAIITQLPFNNMDEMFALIRNEERLNFFERTMIKTVRPVANIELTLPGQYEKLLEHISVHRWFMGERQNSEVSYSDAVAGWFDEVYLPLANVIIEQNVLKDFPKRTVTDLYLWIIEHLWYLREQYKDEISLEDAATHFTKEYAKKPKSRVATLFQKLADILAETPPIELGIMPEDLMIDGGENQSKEDKTDEEETTGKSG